MHYLLFYEVGEDYVSKRAPFREAHLERAWKASARGELVLGGALSNPVDGAVLLFRGDSPEVAENFARLDPYVTSGAVKRWYVREWTTVAGKDSAMPVRPNAIAGNLTPSGSSKPLDGDPPARSQQTGTVLRMWKARCTAEKSAKYVDHVTKKVFPLLCSIDGHRGAYLLQRVLDNAIEFVVLTLWESMEAVCKFAGPKTEKAVVDPDAQAVLTAFDESATHYQVIYSADVAAKPAQK
jgi:hypothetical protein